MPDLVQGVSLSNRISITIIACKIRTVASLLIAHARNRAIETVAWFRTLGCPSATSKTRWALPGNYTADIISSQTSLPRSPNAFKTFTKRTQIRGLCV
jgi:hypothetical protein